MEDFKRDFPGFAKRGWGATVKAETWNGRHAMFGMLVLWITAYVKAHGLIPDADKLLDLSQWGTLADLGGSNPISNERAIILIAHVHVLIVSIAAAIAPFSFQDKLLLEPGEGDAEPAGLIPPIKFGLTKEAETWNGRLAMLGENATQALHTPVFHLCPFNDHSINHHESTAAKYFTPIQRNSVDPLSMTVPPTISPP